MTASSEYGFEMPNKKQLGFICPRLVLYHELLMNHQAPKRV